MAGPWEQNCYVLATEQRDAVVVDPGGEAQRIASVVASHDLRVHAVLATHGHHDHVGAAGELVELYGVPFGIHSGDADHLERVNFCRFAFQKLGPVEIPPIGLDLADAAHVSFDSLDLTIVQTPGHSRGSVCLEADGELLTGDTLLATGRGRAHMPRSDATLLDASVLMLAREYPSDTAIHPGHGPRGRLGVAVAGIDDAIELRS